MALHYVTGDASKPGGDHAGIIVAHVVNNWGKWGAGFTASLNRQWPWMAQWYKDGLAERVGRLGVAGSLGQVIYFKTDSGLVVANMVAQNGLRGKYTPQPLSYDALRRCLRHVRAEALYDGRSVHMPRIGAGLGGGEWQQIEQIINDSLVWPSLVSDEGIAAVFHDGPIHEVDVFVYTLPEEVSKWTH